MKKFLFVPLLALVLSACAGTAARENVLLPSMLQVWPRIAIQVHDGATAAVAAAEIPAETLLVIDRESERMLDALERSDLLALASVNWSGLRPYAIRNIQDRTNAGQIGAGVAATLVERIKQFDLSYDLATKARNR